jgi:predicted dehydrogenase
LAGCYDPDERLTAALAARYGLPGRSHRSRRAGAALLEYADKLATFDMTAWGAPPWTESWTVELAGTEGMLHVGLQPPWYRLFLRRPQAAYQAGWHSCGGTGVTGYRNSLVPGANYWSELEHMVALVRAWDTANDRWHAEVDAVITVLDAIYQSHAKGDAVTVKLSQESTQR